MRESGQGLRGRWAGLICALLLVCAAPACGAEAEGCPDGGLAACTGAIAAAGAPAEKAHLLMQRAKLLRHEGNFQGAEADLGKARALAPEDADILVELGYLKRAEGDLEAALAAHSSALALDPHNWRALLNRMDALASLGRNEACLAEAPRAIQLASDEPYTYAYRGRCRAGVGQAALAVGDYEKAAGMGLDAAFLYANLALAELDLGRNEKALAAARTAIARDPANAYGQYARIDALLQLRRTEEAVAAYPQARAAIGEDSLGLANLLAWALYRDGRAHEALPIIEGFFRDHPRPDAGQVYEVDTYAHILSAIGERDRALEQFLLAADLGGADKQATYRRHLETLGIAAAPGRAGLAAALTICVEAGARCRLSD